MTSPDDVRPDGTFPDHVVQAVCRHMDDDHAAGALAIVRRLGGQPDARSAQTTGVDGASIHFLVDLDDGRQVPVRVAFAEPARSRAQIRTAVVALSDRAGGH